MTGASDFLRDDRHDGRGGVGLLEHLPPDGVQVEHLAFSLGDTERQAVRAALDQRDED